MKKLFIILPLLLYATGFTMEPPSIVWTKTFFPEGSTYFFDVHETADEGYIVAGFSHSNGSNPPSSLFRFTPDGVLEWATTPLGYSSHVTYWAEELSDGSFIAVGRSRLINAPTKGVMLLKVDSDGNEIWTTAFDNPGTTDTGNCVVPLEDGYAIAGNQGDKAWIIRTDLQGDSLWSATYQGLHQLSTRRILQVDNTLIVFYTGADVGILAYSIDDGQLLWVSDNYPGSFGGYVSATGDLTSSTTDDGFTFVTTYFPKIAHTDSQGNLLWYYEIPYHSQPYGHSINNTMDGGYIYGGENTRNVEPAPGIQAGMVVKYDSEGNEQWRDYVYETDVLKCIRQLSSGGYIACGGEWSAELIRYEPETGIEAGGDVDGFLITALTPNPFSSKLNIGFNLAEASDIELSVFDLSGRLIADVEEGFFLAGEHSSAWTPEDISSGCYLVRLSTPEDCYVKNCVFIP